MSRSPTPILPRKIRPVRFITKSLEKFVYASRWLLAPMYVGLVFALGVYAFKFLLELKELIWTANTSTEAEVMLIVLGLVDITMIANLILMIVLGGWTIFIEAMDFSSNGSKPQWLNHISAGTLKVKMGMSLLGVTAIHLLKDFVDAEKMSWDTLWKRILIHGIFILSALILAIIDWILHPNGHEPQHKDHSPVKE